MRIDLRISLFWIWNDSNIRTYSLVITTFGYCPPSWIFNRQWWRYRLRSRVRLTLQLPLRLWNGVSIC